jgi:hypothetical protein
VSMTRSPASKIAVYPRCSQGRRVNGSRHIGNEVEVWGRGARRGVLQYLVFPNPVYRKLFASCCCAAREPRLGIRAAQRGALSGMMDRHCGASESSNASI